MYIPNDFHQTPPAADDVSWDAPVEEKNMNIQTTVNLWTNTQNLFAYVI